MTDDTILALDIAFANVGYAVRQLNSDALIAAGCVHPAPAPPKTHRHQYVADVNFQQCVSWAREVSELVWQWKPIAIVAELPSGGAQSAKTMKLLGQAAAMMAAIHHRYPDALFIPVTPGEVKQAARVGKRKGKQPVIEAALALHPELKDMGIKSKDLEHACDATMAMHAALDDAANAALWRMAGLATAEDEDL